MEYQPRPGNSHSKRQSAYLPGLAATSQGQDAFLAALLGEILDEAPFSLQAG